MTADWAGLCRAKDLSVDEPHVGVQFGDGRRHRVTIADQGDAYLISAIVVRPAAVTALPDLPVQSWIRNRTTQLVGFRIDRQRRLVVEGWIPKAALTAEEFQLYVRTAAAEADRFEYVLTGRDAE
jgi:hypothetical protein